MIRRLTFLFGGWLVWVVVMTFPAYADAGPHRGYVSGTPGTGCASCHRAHTAAAPDLLTQAQPALCYACHGDSGTGAELDVEGGLSQTATDPTKTALRGGGFKYSLIDTNPADATGWSTTPALALSGKTGTIPVLTLLTRQLSTSTHTNDGTAATMWGNGAIGSGAGPTVSLYCSSCHDPHGNHQYRILRPIPRNSDALAPVTPVIIADPATHTYTTNNYFNVDYTESTGATGLDANISAWCTTCHTRYLADSSGPTTASGDTIFAYRHETNDTAAYTPICIQCHVSHGSPATESSRAALVALPGGATPLTSQPSDSRLLRLNNRALCQMCHLR